MTIFPACQDFWQAIHALQVLGVTGAENFALPYVRYMP